MVQVSWIFLDRCLQLLVSLMKLDWNTCQSSRYYCYSYCSFLLVIVIVVVIAIAVKEPLFYSLPYACQTGSICWKVIYIYVAFPYLCPNYNIYVQIAIYISRLQYLYLNDNMYVQNVNKYISKCCVIFKQFDVYMSHNFRHIYIFSCKYYM